MVLIDPLTQPKLHMSHVAQEDFFTLINVVQLTNISFRTGGQFYVSPAINLD